MNKGTPESATTTGNRSHLRGTVVEALCNDCGTVRKCTSTFLGLSSNRPLRCKTCGDATEHYRIDADCTWDWREVDNAEQNVKNATLFAQLEASLVMLDRLGIRFELVESDEWYAKIWRERGRGSETRFIDLAADLTLAGQVKYLASAWNYLLPAAESHSLNPWVQDDEDPEMEWYCISWPRQS
jgi:hypothetical protein